MKGEADDALFGSSASLRGSTWTARGMEHLGKEPRKLLLHCLNVALSTQTVTRLIEACFIVCGCRPHGSIAQDQCLVLDSASLRADYCIETTC